jgi:hypothetical protein
MVLLHHWAAVASRSLNMPHYHHHRSTNEDRPVKGKGSASEERSTSEERPAVKGKCSASEERSVESKMPVSPPHVCHRTNYLGGKLDIGSCSKWSCPNWVGCKQHRRQDCCRCDRDQLCHLVLTNLPPTEPNFNDGDLHPAERFSSPAREPEHCLIWVTLLDHAAAAVTGCIGSNAKTVYMNVT